jgi:rhamnosyl/mannosyltransferase
MARHGINYREVGVARPLRICHLGKYYPPASGGIETHVRTIAQAQVRMGASVTVYCFQHENAPTSREQDGAVEVVRFHRQATLGKLDLSIGMVSALARVDADVIHVQVPNPAAVLALLLARPRVPVVVTYQSDVVRQKLLARLFLPLERLFYRRVRLILTTSPTYPAGSRFLVGLRDRLAVLPMGIDLEPYRRPSARHREAAEALRQRFGRPLWLACGRLVYYKGLLTAVRALSRTPGTLQVVGDGPEQAALEAEAQRLGVRDRIVFVGAVPYQEIVPYYLAADAFWFPSNARSEAFGLVQVEAMACGCPVINTALFGSGVAWVSPHEVSGLTVPVDDPEAFAAAAHRLLEEPGLRAHLSGGAQARAQSEFDHRVMAERSMVLYQAVLQGQPVVSVYEAARCILA